MAPRRLLPRIVTLSTLVLALLLGAATWSSWDHIRFVWLFESLGMNAQGYFEYRHRRSGIVMVRLPGGAFWMGEQLDDPLGQNYDPKTDLTGSDMHVHQVILSPFLIGKYEVTQAQWQAMIGTNPSYFQGRYAPAGVGSETLPVDSVYRDELTASQGFLEQTGLKLPTEAQWEYACRGGKTRPVPGPGELDETAWYDASGKGATAGSIAFPPNSPPPPKAKTHPVGGKKPNGFGLHDMLGNVEEWCADSFNAAFYVESEGMRDPLAQGPTGADGIFRGGSWGDSAEACRCARRNGWRTDESRVSTFGFRVAFYPVP